MHIGRGDELLILFSVRREGHTAVEEHLNIRPYLLQMRLACHLHHTGQHREHPRGYTRNIRHVLRHRLSGNLLTLDLKIA